MPLYTIVYLGCVSRDVCLVIRLEVTESKSKTVSYFLEFEIYNLFSNKDIILIKLMCILFP